MDLMNRENIEEMEKVSHFSRREAWGKLEKLSSYLVFSGIVPYRNVLGKSVIINNAYAESGHAKHSMHYKGLAIDCHSGASLYEQCESASKIGFSAIGAYPFWNNPGIHVDMRGLVGKDKVFWIRDERKALEHDKAFQKGEYWYFVNAQDWLHGVSRYEEIV